MDAVVLEHARTSVTRVVVFRLRFLVTFRVAIRAALVEIFGLRQVTEQITLGFMIVLGVPTTRGHGRGLVAHISNPLVNPISDLAMGLGTHHL